jgi:uncharacterized membrane protein
MDDRGGLLLMQHPYWAHAGDGHPLGHALLLVLIALLLVAAVLWLYRTVRPPTAVQPLVPATGSPSEALGIVRLRYARGEIGRDEFQRMSVDLGAAPATGAEEAAPEPPAPGDPAD